MAGTLTIGRLRADCTVAGSPAAAADVRDRTLRALRDHLPPMLKSGLGPVLDGRDDSVWVVRRLDLAIAVAADMPPDDLAARTATSFSQILGETLRDQGDGVNAIRFVNRVSYLAQFIVDAATADPWSRWYFAPLRGWKALPASAAIRTALTESPEHTREILASLDDRALASVAAALRPDDERAVVESMTRASREGAMSVAVIRDALDGCRRAFRMHLTSGRLLFALTRASTPPSRPLLAAIRATLDEVEVQQRRGSRHAGDASVSAGLTRLEGFDAMPESDRSSIVAAVRQLAGLSHDLHGSDANAAQPPDLFVTPFGGLSLLLRECDALPWEEWTAGWPSLSSVSARVLLRWLALARCGGRTNVGPILRDPAWRFLLDIPSDLDMDKVLRWVARVQARRLVARIARMLLTRFANRLPGFAASTPEYLWRNVLNFDAVIECEADRILVRCGRPPLHLVLSLTGMTRGLEAGRLADGRPILVFSRD